MASVYPKIRARSFFGCIDPMPSFTCCWDSFSSWKCSRVVALACSVSLFLLGSSSTFLPRLSALRRRVQRCWCAGLRRKFCRILELTP
ncbi:hypothetical protein BDR05DRAFT_507314 [Suillus weaverae]|nr:hypothetical protein BDR05DRAFT_507314 [Suillus weaverae]